jgi:tetraacyldisaccharide 4'-kinase
MFKIKDWYLGFLEKEERNFLGSIFYFLLYLLSILYGLAINLRNFLYDKIPMLSFYPSKKVISIGGLSWAGAGKTTLSIYLYKKLSDTFKVSILRRGYGEDENKLLRDTVENVFISVNRCELLRKLSSHFDVFILDDGFQYRRLRRNLDIVIMGARELKKKTRLIPAYFFREPLSSLKRADILILNYKEEMPNPHRSKEVILERFPHLKIYFSTYKFKKLLDLNNNEFNLEFLKGKRVAALSGIGYPEGFLNKLKEMGLEIVEKIIYPDHYELKDSEFKRLQDSLIEKGIKNVVITAKDKYHLPKNEIRLSFFIVEIGIEIEEEDNFLKEIEKSIRG